MFALGRSASRAAQDALFERPRLEPFINYPLPGEPFRTFALLGDPAGPMSPVIAAFPVLPRTQHSEGFSTAMISRLATGLWYPLSTLHERRCRHPCKTRFQLADSAFAVKASNTLGHDERFQITSFLFSRTYPDASWAHAAEHSSNWLILPRTRGEDGLQLRFRSLRWKAARRIAQLVEFERDPRIESRGAAAGPPIQKHAAADRGLAAGGICPARAFVQRDQVDQLSVQPVGRLCPLCP